MLSIHHKPFDDAYVKRQATANVSSVSQVLKSANLPAHLLNLGIKENKIDQFINKIAGEALDFVTFPDEIDYIFKGPEQLCTTLLSKMPGDNPQHMMMSLIYPNKPNTHQSDSLLGIGGYKKVKKSVTIFFSSFEKCIVKDTATFRLIKSPTLEEQETDLNTFNDSQDSLEFIASKVDVSTYLHCLPYHFVYTSKHDAGKAEGEYVKRVLGIESRIETLKARVEKKYYKHLHPIFKILQNACCGSQLLHDLGHVHGDLHSDNIVIKNDIGQLADFDFLNLCEYNPSRIPEDGDQYYVFAERSYNAGYITPFADIRALVINLAWTAFPYLQLKDPVVLRGLTNPHEAHSTLQVICRHTLYHFGSRIDEEKLQQLQALITNTSSYPELVSKLSSYFKDANKRSLRSVKNLLVIKVKIFDMLLRELQHEVELHQILTDPDNDFQKLFSDNPDKNESSRMASEYWQSILSKIPHLTTAKTLALEIEELRVKAELCGI